MKKILLFIALAISTMGLFAQNIVNVPENCYVNFTLNDSYGDNWNGNYLLVSYDGITEQLEIEGSWGTPEGFTQTHTLVIPKGSHVTVTYKKAGSYPDENSFVIAYEDGDEILNVPKNTFTNSTTTKSYEFDVDCTPKAPDVLSIPETIALGNVQVGGYWSEYDAVTSSVALTPVSAVVTNIKSDNPFFIIPSEIDYTANPIEIDVTYNTKASVGEYAGNLVVTYNNGAKKLIPMTATAYAPVRPDVIELAQNITFTDNQYTNTPVFANLRDDYNLPKEVNNGNTPDAVYAFELKEDATVTVDIAGTNAVYAIYEEDFNGQNGAMASNNYLGENSLEFSYDFNDGDLSDFNLFEKDGNNSHWEILNNNNQIDGSHSLVSYSYGNYGAYEADNYIVTKDLYLVTSTSELKFDVVCYAVYNNKWDEVMVKVSTDGENFTLIETVKPESSMKKSITIDLGTKFAELGLEYGSYHIALHHYHTTDIWHIMVDNLQLVNSKPVYNAGKYYLVAAAEDAFTVNVAIESANKTYWTPNESAYANNMSIIGLVQINDVDPRSACFEVGAFCGDEVRGARKIQYVPALDKYLVFLTIHGDSNEEITFRLYDHLTGAEVDVNAPSPINFEVNGALGSIMTPYVLNFKNNYEITAEANPVEGGTVLGAGIYTHGDSVTMVATPHTNYTFVSWSVGGNVVSTNAEYIFTATEDLALTANFHYVQSRELSAGWNWFSSAVEIEGENGLAMIEEALGENGLQIKTQTEFVSYYDGAWFGTLMTANVQDMFMIETSEAHAITLEGDKINPEDYPFTVGTDWRWLSYPVSASLTVDEALSTMLPVTGDYVKSKTAFSQYYEGIGWIGALNTMMPGEGYMYQNTSGMTKTLVYPAASAGKSSRANVVSDNNRWVPEAGRFATNMSLTAVVEMNGRMLKGTGYEIAAFVGDEVRGSARPIYIEALDRYMIFMTVYGEGNEEFTFKYYDVDADVEETVTSRGKIAFAANAVYGSIDEAVVLTCGTVGVEENEAGSINVYPNPASVNAEIRLGMTYDKVEVYNAIGVKVAEYSNVDNIDGIETAGVYMLKVMNGNETRNCRVVVK